MGRLAQLVEHLTYIQEVVGSSPAPPMDFAEWQNPSRVTSDQLLVTRDQKI